MRGRFPLGVILIFALLLGLSSLGLDEFPREIRAQFTLPATETATATPGSVTPTDTNTPTLTETPTSTVGSPPTSTPTATGVVPSATPPLPGSPAPTNKPKQPGAPATPSTGIKVNAYARVVRPEGLNLGQGPGFDFGHVQIVGLNDIVFVLEGPQRGDGLWWWKLRTRDGVEGWGINDHIMPCSAECLAAAGISLTPAATFGAATPLASSGSLAATATRAASGAQQLPATGIGDNWPWFAVALVAVLLGAGFIRRRSRGAA